MKKWTLEKLQDAGYKIENAKIGMSDLSMSDYGVLSLSISLKGASWGCVYGGYVLGHGYVGADDFDGSSAGIECIERIMDVVGVDRFRNMDGKYIRVATKGFSTPVEIIGNIVEDKWFDQKSFFADKNREAEEQEK